MGNVQNRIQMSMLGKMGRFANQIAQYCFLRTWARKHDLQLEVPLWVGSQLFGLVDRAMGPKLPKVVEHSDCMTIPLKKPPPMNCDFEGYFQYHTSYYRPDRGFIQSLFRPIPAIRDRVAPALDRLKSGCNTLVGIHLRRGDYGRGMFYITPTAWYLAKLAELWPTLDRPALFISTESPELVGEFAAYDPQTTQSLGVQLSSQPLQHYNYEQLDRQRREPHQLDFYPDFWLLSQCDVLLMPNSTFSFMAGMLSTTLQKAYRSDLATQRFLPLDVWDSKPLDFGANAEQYRHIPGVCLDSNPYWG